MIRHSSPYVRPDFIVLKHNHLCKKIQLGADFNDNVDLKSRSNMCLLAGMIAGATIEFSAEAILAHLNDLRIYVPHMSSLQGLVTAGCSNIGLCPLSVWLFTVRSSSIVVPSGQI
jgi:hypothetical protein